MEIENHQSNYLNENESVHSLATSGENKNEIKISNEDIDLLKLIAVGLTNDEIAQKLTINPTVLSGEIKLLQSKFTVKDRANLVVRSIESGIIDPVECVYDFDFSLFDGLTERQLDIAGLSASGMSNSEIEEELGIGKRFVNSSNNIIYAQLQMGEDMAINTKRARLATLYHAYKKKNQDSPIAS